MKAKFRHSLLAAALAVAALPAAVQASDSPFTQTIFFGDSLTDGGYFRPVLAGVVGPTNAAVIGQFTNNPGYVWSQYLADFYGSNAAPAWTGNNTASPTLAGGNNWAVGGARVGTSAAGGLGYTPSLTAQDVSQLDLVDLTALGGEVLGFFVSKADRAAAGLASPTA